MYIKVTEDIFIMTKKCRNLSGINILAVVENIEVHILKNYTEVKL